MHIKVGNKIYDGSTEPIAVILTKEDKDFIAAMGSDKQIFLRFPAGMSVEDAGAWANSLDVEIIKK